MKPNTQNHHYINGHWMKGRGKPFASTNPVDNSTLWQGTQATEDEVAGAFEAARNALPAWAHLGISGRIPFILAFAKLVGDRQETLTRLIALETGKPLWEARTETASVIGKAALSIQAYQERMAEKKTIHQDITNSLRYKPNGVVAVLGPFNFPAHLSNGHIIPALLAGNTVVYKPSELTPAVAAFIMQCWHDSGLPAGVLDCIQGDAKTAQYLLSQDIQGVYFTGSYATGKRIHQQFSERPEVILALEMGGNNPLIVDPVAHTKAAVYHALLSTFITAGQRCTCARRMMIPDTTAGDAFLSEFLRASSALRIGAFTSKPEPFMGPVISHEHAQSHLKAQLNLQQRGGHSLLTMALIHENLSFLSPGVIDMTGVQNPPDEEIFAPFVQIYRYHDFEEALMLANQTQFGLAAGLFSDSPERYQSFYQTIRAGLVNWNRPTTGAASSLPFGGVGHSGNHRASGYFATDYCAYPVASLEQSTMLMPESTLPGIEV